MKVVLTDTPSALYAGAWREHAPQIEVSLPQLAAALPALLRDGGAGLLWPRIRHHAVVYGAVGEMLEHTYGVYAAAITTIERDIASVTSLLAAKGIQAVLVKGWALSKLYAAPQVRRPGDIDLIVPDAVFDEAQRVIAEAYSDGLTTGVDLYCDATWRSLPSPDFRQHTVPLPCGDTTVATLGATDTLRHVCLHFTKHLGNRVPNTSPLWLCDIGAIVENDPARIDWDRLLHGDSASTNRIRIALALSRDIVDTRIDLLPRSLEDIRLPDWAASSVVDLWADPHARLGTEIEQMGLRRALVKRLWPSPLNAVLQRSAPVDTLQPQRYQIEVATRLLALYGLRVASGGKLGR